MRKNLLIGVLSVIVAVCATGAVHGAGKEPLKVGKKNVVIVTGKIITKDNSPVKDCDVYIMHVDEGIVVWELNEKKEIINPHQFSNEKGIFVIEVPKEFLDDQPQLGVQAEGAGSAHAFTLAIWPRGLQPQRAVDTNGNSLSFDVSKNQKKIELGSFRTDQLKELGPYAARTH